jgi:2',3'-cyclic-nucleotide 2'-phosphodiesterase (5'-nucleotidase family)
LKASTIVERGGFKVGVVGYTTRDTPTTTLKPSVVGLDFTTEAAQHVAGEIKAMRAAGASPIVLLAHASIDSDLPQKLDDPKDPHGDARKGELNDLLAGMGADVPDVIVAGHRHAWMLGRLRGVPIVSSDQHGVGMSRTRFCRSSAAAAPRFEGIERIVPLASDPPRTELGRTVQAAMKPWLDKVKPQAEAVVTELPKACMAQGLDGTAMMEQLARAIFEHVADAQPAPPNVPVVAFNNAGGLRAPFAAGALHFADLYESFPFENAVAVCGTTRKGLLRAIGNALKKPSVKERMPFGIAGATLHVKRRADGGLDFVSIAFGKGKADHDDDPVWLAIPDFLLWGGDGFLDGVTCAPGVGSQTRMRDAWRGVLEREKKCDGPSTTIVVDR